MTIVPLQRHGHQEAQLHPAVRHAGCASYLESVPGLQVIQFLERLLETLMFSEQQGARQLPPNSDALILAFYLKRGKGLQFLDGTVRACIIASDTSSILQNDTCTSVSLCINKQVNMYTYIYTTVYVYICIYRVRIKKYFKMKK